jgi:peptide deformylase
VFVTDVLGDGLRVYINPILTITDYDQAEVEECCHSYPRTDATRLRHKHIILDYLTFSGKSEILDTMDGKYSVDVARRLAVRIQHEMEHLYGLSVRDEPKVGEGLELLTSQPIRIMG